MNIQYLKPNIVRCSLNDTSILLVLTKDELDNNYHIKAVELALIRFNQRQKMT